MRNLGNRVITYLVVDASGSSTLTFELRDFPSEARSKTGVARPDTDRCVHGSQVACCLLGKRLPLGLIELPNLDVVCEGETPDEGIIEHGLDVTRLVEP